MSEFDAVLDQFEAEAIEKQPSPNQPSEFDDVLDQFEAEGVKNRKSKKMTPEELEAHDSAENQKLTQIRNAVLDEPSQQLSATKISRITGVPIDKVFKNYEAYRKLSDLKEFDPQKYRETNPEEYRAMVESPELAGTIYKEEKISDLALAMAGVGDYLLKAPAWKQGLLAAFPIATPAIIEAEALLGNIKPAERRQNVAYQKKDIDNPLLQIADTFNYSYKNLEKASLGSKLAYYDRVARTKRRQKEAGLKVSDQELIDAENDALQVRTQIARLDKEIGLQPDYGEGAAMRYVLDAVNAFSSQVDVIAGAAKGAAVGGVLGAATGSGFAGIGAVPGMVTGFQLGGRAGMAVSSFQLEQGGSYLELMDAKDDDGNLVDDDIAFGASVAYGLAAAGVEMAGFEALMKAGPKVFLDKALKTKALKNFLKDLGVGVVSEGGEEAMQEALGIASTYLARGASSGKGIFSQEFDTAEKLKQISSAGVSGALGGVALGGATHSAKVLGELSHVSRSQKNGEQMAALNEVAKSDIAKAAPDVVAKLYKRHAEKNGIASDHVYIDPAKMVQKLKEQGLNPKTVVKDLLGPEGEVQLQEATEAYINDEGKRNTLKIPVRDYLEKWGGSELAESLAQDTSVAEGELTANELSARIKRETKLHEAAMKSFDEDVAKLQKEMAEQGWTPSSVAEEKFAESIRKNLIDTGDFTKEEADLITAVQRAALVGIARLSNMSLEDIMATRAVEIAKATPEQVAQMTAVARKETVEGTDQGQTRRASPAQTADLRKSFQSLTQEQKRKLYWQDRNTGLLNRKGLGEVVKDPSRPLLTTFDVEGTKFINDQFGHLSVDGMFRLVANEVRRHIPDAAKVGGSIVGYVANKEQAERIRQDIAAKLGTSIQITAATLDKPTGSLKTDMEAVDTLSKALKDDLVGAGKLGHRKGAPASISGDLPQIAYEVDEQGNPIGEGIPIASEEAQALLAERAPRLQAVADALLNTQTLGEGSVQSNLAELYDLMSDDEAFDAIHFEPDTGLLTEVGWNRARELNHRENVTSADLRSIRIIDQTFGREQADEVLATFGSVMATLAEQVSEATGVQIDVAHLHGDEYAAQCDNDRVLKAYWKVLGKVSEKILFLSTDEKGSIIMQSGVQFAYGTAKTFDEADRVELKKFKKEQRNPPEPKTRSTKEAGRDTVKLLRKGFIPLGTEKLLSERSARDGQKGDTRSLFRQLAEELIRSSPQEISSKISDENSLLADLMSGFMSFDMYLEVTGLGSDTTLTDQQKRDVEKIREGDVQADTSGVIKSTNGETLFQGPMEVVDTLRQGEESKPRGILNISKTGIKKVMKIFTTDQSDISTPLHEMAHVYYDMLADLAADPMADQNLKDTWKKVLKFVGGDEKEAISPVEQKERFARAFEAYLLEGKAPSLDLVQAFQKFRSWLLRIYKSIRALDVELDDNIRDVFDRLLATDEEIAIMRDSIGADLPLYKDLETALKAGITEQQYRRIQKLRADDEQRQRLRVQREVAHAQKKALDAEWRAEVKKNREVAEGEWNRRNDVRAWRLLYSGDRVDQYGEVVFSNRADGKLDREKVRKIAKLNSPFERKLHTRLVDGGLDPTGVAKSYGFESAERMFNAIVELPDKRAWIRGRANELTTENHPELALERNKIQEVAREKAHQEGSSDALIQEWMWMLEQGRIENFPSVEAMREVARRMVNSSPTVRIPKQRMISRQLSSATKAMQAAARGDFDEAAKHKTHQIISHFAYRFYDEAAKKVAKLERLAKQMNNDAQRKKFGIAGEDYLELADRVLSHLGFRDPIKDNLPPVDTTIIRKLESLDMDLSRDGGKALEFINGPRPERGWRELDISTLSSVLDMLTQLKTAALQANSIVVEGNRVLLDTAADEIAQGASHKPDLGKLAPKTGKAPKGVKVQNPGLARKVLASLTSPQRIFEELGEPAVKMFWREGYLKALYDRDDLTETVTKKIVDLWDNVPEAMQRSRYDVLDDVKGVELPSDLEQLQTQDRQWMWMVALNMGNTSNKERLLGGYGWDESAVIDWLNRNITKEEMDFLQGIWDLLDNELFTRVADTYKKVNGIPPPKIEATPLSLNHGLYRGGYVPARYSPVDSRYGGEQSVEDLRNRYNESPGRVSIAKSFTKERAKKFNDIIDLTWEILPSHIASVIHYVSHEPVVRDLIKLSNHPDVKNTIRHRLGEQYISQVDDWLKTIASSRPDAVPSSLQANHKILQYMRSSFVTTAIGFSTSVAAGDLVNPLVAVTTRQVGMKNMTRELAVNANPWKFYQTRSEVLEHSPGMRHRAENHSRLLLKHMGEIGMGGRKTRVGKLIDGAREAAFVFFDWTDKLTSTVIWKAAYRDALDAGKSEKSAIQHADDVITASLPSFDPGMLNGILRDKRGMASLLVFYSYFSTLYNLQRKVWEPALTTIGNEGYVRGMGEVAKATGYTLATIVAFNVLGEFLSGRGPEEDEDTEDWIARKVLSAPFTLVPIFGGVGEAAANNLVSLLSTGEVSARKFSSRTSPAMSALDSAAKSLYKFTQGDNEDYEKFLAVLQFAGLALGVPLGTGQVRRTLDYLLSGEASYDVKQGDPAGIAGGLLYGKRENQGVNPLSIIEKE